PSTPDYRVCYDTQTAPPPTSSLFFMHHPPPPSTLFPYTTLFRSHASPPPPSATPDDDVPTTGRWRALDETSSARQRPVVGTSSSDRKSTRLNSSHDQISYAVFCLKKKKNKQTAQETTQEQLNRNS